MTLRSDGSDRAPLGTALLAGSFALSGIVHLVRPAVFEALIPPVLGSPRGWVYVSGLAELACAVGLVRRAEWAPGASAALLAGVWVGNWWMAIDATRARPRQRRLVAISWARVPLQLPMIRTALRSPVRSA